MIKNLEDIAKLLGTDSKTLTEAFSKEEEVEITIPLGTFLNDEQLNDLKAGIKKEGYNEGKTAGSEMYAKDLKRLAGIDDKPGKSADDVFKYLNEKLSTDLKVEPNKKIQELTESITNLQGEIEQITLTKDAEISKYKTESKKSKIESKLLAKIPAELEGIKHNHAMTIIQTEYQFDIDENDSLVVMKGGKVLKDKLEKPIEVDTVINQFITDNGWKKGEGRGGGDIGGGSSSRFKDKNELFKHMETNGIKATSSQGIALLTEFEKENK